MPNYLAILKCSPPSDARWIQRFYRSEPGTMFPYMCKPVPIQNAFYDRVSSKFENPFDRALEFENYVFISNRKHLGMITILQALCYSPNPLLLPNPEPTWVMWMFGSYYVSTISYNMYKSQIRPKKI